MALFKIFKGNSSTLPGTYKDGYCYFTVDDGKMYIDTKDSDSTGRICLNAKHSDTADLATNATNADKLDGYHESSFLRLRSSTSIDGENTLWTGLGIKEYYGAYPDNLDNKIYSWGQVITLSGNDCRFELFTNHNSSALGTSNGIQYRSGWGNDKKPWNMILDSKNFDKYALPLTGGTINGELRIGNNLRLLSTSDEGGNIIFITPNGNLYEIDNYDNDLRIYGVNNNVLQGYWRFLKDGSFRSSGHIQTDNSFYSYQNNRTVGLQTDSNGNSCWINFKDENNFTQIALINESMSKDHIGHIYRKQNGALEDYVLFHSGNLGTFIHDYAIPKWGGELTGQIIKHNNGTWWQGGRDAAAIRCPSSGDNSWFPVTSCKTLSGDISNGVLGNTMYWIHTTDTEYAAGNNITSTLAWLDINGNFGASRIYGAVWNDYAEYRSCKEEFKPGQVVYENGDDTLSVSNSRLQRGCSIVSDTFGFAIGETDEAKCPIAVSGRVLAYGYEPREEFKKHIGWPVCSGPKGTVSIMTEEEEEKYPSRIIGTISAVPDYAEWGTENIKVDNRIWIKVK